MNQLALSPCPVAPIPGPRTPSLVVDAAAFAAWLKAAHPGSPIEYHRGHLVIDRQPKLDAPDNQARAALHRLATRVLKAADQGLVYLVQQRHGREDFSYLAIKARPAPPRKRGGRS